MHRVSTIASHLGGGRDFGLSQNSHSGCAAELLLLLVAAMLRTAMSVSDVRAAGVMCKMAEAAGHSNRCLFYVVCLNDR